MEEGEIEEVEEVSTKNDEKKEPRQRKKMLLNDVMNQLEFYFSSVNLRKDLFMQELLAKSPYIDLEIFKRFNKLKKLTTDTRIMQKAVRNSSLLELSEDKMGVRRSTPLEEKKDELDCTIYVENLPPLVTHEWVRKIFETYGVIDYVSLPCFKASGHPKGFAFIEYHTATEAQLALSAFEGLTPFNRNLSPGDLLSIKTYDQEEYLKNNAPPHHGIQGLDYDQDVRGNKRSHADAFQGEQVAVSHAEKEEDKSGVSKSSKKSKKKKRKRSKKEKPYENSSYLRVMSKKNWKSLRNQYLDLQRQNISLLKSLNHEMKNSHSNSQFPSDEACNPTKKEAATKPEFVPGIIVKITLDDPPDDHAAFRKSIQTTYLSVAYIDIQGSDVYIRFKSPDNARDFAYRSNWSESKVLSGREESDYWDRIVFSWEQKRLLKDKKSAESKQNLHLKGRHKVIQKALKLTEKPALGSHVIFSDE